METLGGFSEIGFGGETIHPSWSFSGGNNLDFFIELQSGRVFLVGS
jgi:hypothetical protein